ncbi:hypothetical protein PAPYR_11018 [Paratrimastix pyriformis]|uniref:Uncharacterized protein n=1 Tax=Paratrimastix pyriformis TaxID=342808 RepID=A0ABQ8U9Q7_9EUKA|nr:hypothetical protein PAPYR_11018 [Paratrimastix pyriformis]
MFPFVTVSCWQTLFRILRGLAPAPLWGILSRNPENTSLRMSFFLNSRGTPAPLAEMPVASFLMQVPREYLSSAFMHLGTAQGLGTWFTLTTPASPEIQSLLDFLRGRLLVGFTVAESAKALFQLAVPAGYRVESPFRVLDMAQACCTSFPVPSVRIGSAAGRSGTPGGTDEEEEEAHRTCSGSLMCQAALALGESQLTKATMLLVRKSPYSLLSAKRAASFSFFFPEDWLASLPTALCATAGVPTTHDTLHSRHFLSGLSIHSPHSDLHCATVTTTATTTFRAAPLGDRTARASSLECVVQHFLVDDAVERARVFNRWVFAWPQWSAPAWPLTAPRGFVRPRLPNIDIARCAPVVMRSFLAVRLWAAWVFCVLAAIRTPPARFPFPGSPSECMPSLCRPHQGYQASLLPVQPAPVLPLQFHEDAVHCFSVHAPLDNSAHIVSLLEDFPVEPILVVSQLPGGCFLLSLVPLLP